MKHNIFIALALAACAFISCEQGMSEKPALIATDKGSYTAPQAGGAVIVKVLSSEDWKAEVAPATSLDDVKGITVEPATGKASDEPVEVKVNFPANAGYNRAATVSFIGKTLSAAATITQEGAEGERIMQVTVKEFLEKEVDASVFYEITGTVIKITDEYYNDFWINDGSVEGDGVYVYGLFQEKGAARINNYMQQMDIREGDILTMRATRSAYNGQPQAGNAYYVSHEKSKTPSIAFDLTEYEASAKGEEFTINVSSNVVTWTISADQTWVHFDPATGNASAAVKVTVDAGEGGEATVTLSATGLESVTGKITRADVAVLTCAEFNALPNDNAKTYELSGIVRDIVMDKNDNTKYNKYGNFWIEDRTGKVYIYGLLPAKGGESGQDVLAANGIKEGDFITVAAPHNYYADKSQHQGKNAWYLNHYESLTMAEFKAKEVDKTKKYVVRGAITLIDNNQYGNCLITDGTETLYTYTFFNWEGEKKKFDELGLAVNDTVTIYGNNDTYTKTINDVTYNEICNCQPILISKYVAPAATLDICEQIFVDAGYKMEDFTRLEIDWTHNGYWNSTDGTNHSKIITKDVSPNATNLTQFAATPQYHRSALPVGTVLVIQGSTSEVANGWMYRPEGWQSKGSKNSGSRPDNVTGKTSPVVAINDAWWGTSFNYRAFNVARVGNPNLTEAQQEELEHVFGIFVPKPFASTDAIMTAKGYDLSKYTKLEFTITQKAYYNSNSNSSMVTGQSNCVQFAATNIVEKAQIPNGSVIVVNVGYQYRPEGWTALDGKNATRPGNVGNTVTVVDDAWWGSFNYRAFNLAKFGNPNLTDAEQAGLAAAFAVYVPKN